MKEISVHVYYNGVVIYILLHNATIAAERSSKINLMWQLVSILPSLVFFGCSFVAVFFPLNHTVCVLFVTRMHLTVVAIKTLNKHFAALKNVWSGFRELLFLQYLLFTVY